jgi:2-dehydropantoate 2-reductase
MTTTTEHRIAIWGVGALGSLFAGYLSTVAPVTMVGRWPEQVATVQRDGLKIHHADGRVSHCFPAITDHPAALPPVDLAVVLVKSHQTAGIAPAIAGVLSPNGVAITLQNGVGNLDALARVVGVERATQGVTAQGANFVGLGAVRHAGAGLTHIAVLPERAGLIETLIALLNRTGIETYATDSADSLVWGKLAVNAGLNPLTALLDVPNGDLLIEPQRQHLMIAAAREVEAVAAAQGIRLPYPDVAAQVQEVARVTGANISSMLQDVRRQVPTEIDAMCGAVVRYGERLHVPTPVNAMLFDLMRAKESGQTITPEAVYRALSQVVPRSGRAIG